MHGADADVLQATGQRFVRSSEQLRQHRVVLGWLLTSSGWAGADADAARSAWNGVTAPALLRTSAFMELLGRRLIEHASEQRRASGATAASAQVAVGRFDRDPVYPPVARSPTIVGLRPSAFEPPTDGRDAVVSAMRGLSVVDRIGRDEIEIRALDNGRYIVVLPGVTDLSAGAARAAKVATHLGSGYLLGAGWLAIRTWADNDDSTVRKMRHAYDAARGGTAPNEYAVVVSEALRAAGVPAGAEVMLIGHSYGAYTAMDLAADAGFNSAHGTTPGGYHVAVTHVVAAGAETDWRFAEVPAATNTLVINNRFDGVYRVEDVLHPDGHAIHEGHIERNFWGGFEGFGHDEANYVDWLAGTDDGRVSDWLADVGSRYGTGGTRVSVQVPDPSMAD